MGEFVGTSGVILSNDAINVTVTDSDWWRESAGLVILLSGKSSQAQLTIRSAIALSSVEQ